MSAVKNILNRRPSTSAEHPVKQEHVPEQRAHKNKGNVLERELGTFGV